MIEKVKTKEDAETYINYWLRQDKKRIVFEQKLSKQLQEYFIQLGCEYREYGHYGCDIILPFKK